MVLFFEKGFDLSFESTHLSINGDFHIPFDFSVIKPLFFHCKLQFAMNRFPENRYSSTSKREFDFKNP